jgi:hypothetical protein
MHKHVLALSLAALTSVFVLPAQAQSFNTRDAVVRQCAAVVLSEAAAPNVQDHPLRGFCIKATGEFLSALVVSAPSVEDFGNELAQLVVDLTNLLIDHECRFESEVVQAIEMTSSASEDEEQAIQIRRIAATITDCDFAGTAAIPATSGDPASAN